LIVGEVVSAVDGGQEQDETLAASESESAPSDPESSRSGTP